MSKEPGKTNQKRATKRTTHRTKKSNLPKGNTGSKVSLSTKASQTQTRQSPTNLESITNKLLAAANEASGPARNAWLAFLGLLAYLVLTLAGISHKDLLLNSPIELPIISVKVPLISFFAFGPFLVVLVHLSLLMQHATLAHRYQCFSKAIDTQEEDGLRDHPDRRLVHNYVFSQLLAGPNPPPLIQTLMRLMIFITFSLLPVLVLTYFQIKFLPYHDVGTTHLHRLAIVIDLLLLFSMRPYIAMPYLKPQGRKLRFAKETWRWEMSYWNAALTGSACLALVAFSFFVATVPRGCFWMVATPSENCFSLDKMTASWWAAPVRPPVSGKTRVAFAPTAWLFEGGIGTELGKPSSLFSRNIALSHVDLVPDKDDIFDEVSISLRGRDFRYASILASDLHRGDFLGTDLRGAFIVQSRFEKAKLRGANMQRAFLALSNLQEADLHSAQLQGIDLQSTDLRGAQLYGANLSGANLMGANFAEARLYKTNLRGADLRNADMRGARMQSSQLQGSNLRHADLRGASMGCSNLQGADLRFARVWQTEPPDIKPSDLTDTCDGVVPSLEFVRLADFSSIKFSGASVYSSRPTIPGFATSKSLEAILKKGVKSRLTVAEGEQWESSADHQAWIDLARRPHPVSAELSSLLVDLACQVDSDVFIAGVMAKRGLHTDLDNRKSTFNGDPILLAKGLTKKNCRSASSLDFKTIHKLCELSSWPTGEIVNTHCTR